MKSILVALAATLLFAAPVYGHAAPPAAIDLARASAVSVLADETEVDFGDTPQDSTYTTFHSELICSGFVVAARGPVLTVATARHCLEDEPLTFLSGVPYGEVTDVLRYVQFYDGDKGIVTHTYMYPDADIALLTVVARHSHPPVTFNTQALRYGEHLFVFGSPNATPWVYSDALAMRGDQTVTPQDAGYDYHFIGVLYIDCPSCYFGDSGAPTFNDAGEVVGLFNSSLGGSGSWGGVEPALWIKSAMRAQYTHPNASCESHDTYPAYAQAAQSLPPNAHYFALLRAAQFLNVCAHEAQADPVYAQVEGRPHLARLVSELLEAMKGMVTIDHQRHREGQAADDLAAAQDAAAEFLHWSVHHDDVATIVAIRNTRLL